MKNKGQQRRDFFKLLGVGGASLAVPSVFASCSSQNSKSFQTIYEKVFSTPFVDTHEHLYKEIDRIEAKEYVGNKCNDWTIILNHYLDSDLQSAGMPQEDYDKLFEYNENLTPKDKWKLLAPYWPFVKNTGYGQAVVITIKELYGIDDLNENTVDLLQQKYTELIKPGYYKEILQKKANIESCQVNLWPIMESDMPDFLMTDINMSGMIDNPGNPDYADRSGLPYDTLSDWHKVIDWWFNRFGKYAMAVKIGNAYSRNLKFTKTKAEEVEKTYKLFRNKDILSVEEKQKLEDHLFWYVVDKANENNLPIKIHTGYHAQWAGKTNNMDMYMVRDNPVEAARLCDMSPETRFVFFHISYPYYEEMLAVAKQFHNAYMDMCWAWIINPVAAKDFFKKFIVTVPANKIFPFGGDYRPVEPVLGHSVIARNGIALALSELVDEGYISMNDAINYTDLIMHENAKKVFDLEEKTKLLKNLDWETI